MVSEGFGSDLLCDADEDGARQYQRPSFPTDQAIAIALGVAGCKASSLALGCHRKRRRKM